MSRDWNQSFNLNIPPNPRPREEASDSSRVDDTPESYTSEFSKEIFDKRKKTTLTLTENVNY